MTINDIITKHWGELSGMSQTPDKVISLSRTSDDIVQDAIVTALRKFKRKEVEEEEGLQYLRKAILYEVHFQYPRKKGEIITFTDNLNDNMGD